MKAIGTIKLHLSSEAGDRFSGCKTDDMKIFLSYLKWLVEEYH